jgi:hypothetical protein
MMDNPVHHRQLLLHISYVENLINQALFFTCARNTVLYRHESNSVSWYGVNVIPILHRFCYIYLCRDRARQNYNPILRCMVGIISKISHL